MPAFGFKEAQNIVAYLEALGISDIYAITAQDVKSGKELRMSEVLQYFPVALLLSEKKG